MIMSINTAVPVASPSPTGAAASPTASPGAAPTPSKAPVTAPHQINSKLGHIDGLAWSPDSKQVALAVNGELQVYSASAADGAAPVKKFLNQGNAVTAVDWSAPISEKTPDALKPGPGPLAIVDGLLNATRLPAAADNSPARPLTKIYLWQFDSTRASPVASITDPSAAVLSQYPPLPASVVFHHWAPAVNWQLLGGCFRYRVVVAGSVPPTASTFGLESNTPCNAAPSPPAGGSPKATP
jgi:hypothetical protein